MWNWFSVKLSSETVTVSGVGFIIATILATNAWLRVVETFAKLSNLFVFYKISLVGDG